MSLDLAEAFGISIPAIAEGDILGPPVLPPYKLIDDTEHEPVRRVERCYICRKRGPKKVSVLEHCGHQFCTSCLKQWAKFGDTCPMCRAPIREGRTKLEKYVEKLHPIVEAKAWLDMSKPWNKGVRDDNPLVNPVVPRLKVAIAAAAKRRDEVPKENWFPEYQLAVLEARLAKAETEPVPAPIKW